MDADSQIVIPEEAVHQGSRASRLIPVGLLCALAVAVAINGARGRNDQTLTGVIVMDYPGYEFYPDLKDCHLNGKPYWLVPDSRFHDVVPGPSTSDFDHLDSLFHAAWKAKLHGNVSRIGRYGFRGKYMREFDVLYAIDAVQLNCKQEDIRTIH
jgi:hypothetical protein